MRVAYTDTYLADVHRDLGMKVAAVTRFFGASSPSAPRLYILFTIETFVCGQNEYR